MRWEHEAQREEDREGGVEKGGKTFGEEKRQLGQSSCRAAEGDSQDHRRCAKLSNPSTRAQPWA